MANLIVISGPHAVGKMTVAESLKEKIGYALMINHDSIEVSFKIFGIDNDAQRELNKLVRKDVFDVAIKYNVDMIFTYVTMYDKKSDMDYLNGLRDLYEASGGKFYYVELEADEETRLQRNVTPHRLESKKSKNDIERSTKMLLDSKKEHKLNTEEGEKIFSTHIKINNTNLEPMEVADIIIEKYNLKSLN